MEKSKGKIIYAATPFRLEYLTESICDFIEEKRNFPLSPLLTMPHRRFNYVRHSRENIYRVCYGLVDISDELWIFGIGGGALKEWVYAKEKGKPVISFIKVFDPLWEEWSKKQKYLDRKYKAIVEEVLELSKVSKKAF